MALSSGSGNPSLFEFSDLRLRVAEFTQYFDTAATQPFGMAPQPAGSLAELHRYLDMTDLPFGGMVDLGEHPHSLQMRIAEQIVWSIHGTTGDISLPEAPQPLGSGTRPHALGHNGVQRIDVL